MHQWLPERLPREKSRWQLLPLVPGSLGKRRNEGRSQRSQCSEQRAGSSAERLILAYSGPAWSGGQGGPLEASERVVQSRNYENLLMMLLPGTSGLLAPALNPHQFCPCRLCLGEPKSPLYALCSTFPTSQGLRTLPEHRPLLGSDLPEPSQPGGKEVSGSHSLAVCLSFPHKTPNPAEGKKRR